MYDETINIHQQHELERLKIKFIADYITMTIHTGESLINLVKEAKEAWAEIIKQ